MRRAVIMGTVAVLVVGVAAVGVQAASTERRQPAAREVPVVSRVSQTEAVERLHRMAARLSVALDSEFESFSRVNCRDVECLNRELTQLSRFANRTAAHLDRLDEFARDQLALWNDWYALWNECMNYVLPVTWYGDPAGSAGYLYTNDLTNVFATTALDITYSGDPVTAYLNEWTCEVTEESPGS